LQLDELAHVQRLLGNGLSLCVVPLPQMHRAVLHAQLSIGSRFETSADNGVSHFLEHMLYRGTPSYPSAHEQALVFERRGASLDATTACDTGTLAISGPADELMGLVPAFAEVFRSPRFSGIEIERGIVREEILESMDDEGTRVDADDLIRELVFSNHGLGLPITGTLEHLDAFDVDRLQGHHERFYTARNSVIVAAGRLEPNAVLDSLEQQFEDLASGTALGVTRPGAQEGPRFRFVSHSSSQTNLRLAFRAPGWGDQDQAATEVLVRLLDDGMSTRLYHRICDQRGLCYDVSAGYETYVDSGLFEIRAETSHDHAHEVLSELFDVVHALRDEGPSVEELRATVSRFRWQAESMLDEPEGLAEYTADAIQYGESLRLMERCSKIGSVTVADVRDAAQRWWTERNLNVLAVGLLNKRQRLRLERVVAEF
jgi:predicted Zn-dependent peptidase